MKKITGFIIVCAGLFLFSCGEKESEGVKVFGKVENPIKGELALLTKFNFEGFKTLDTISVESSGAFTVYIPATEPSFYRLNFFNRQQMNLILDGTEDQVEVLIEGDNPQGEVSIKGAKHTKYLQQIEGMMRDQQADVQDLNQKAMEARQAGDDDVMKRLTEEYFALMRVSQDEIKKFIWSVTPSLSAFYGLESLPLEEHFAFHDSIAQRFKAELPGNMFTEQMVKRVEGIRKLAVGAEAPEISLPNPDGEIVTLTSLRGKYVLIDFWAAWCRPCRAENPNVKKLYAKYAGENFEILGVSLDRNKEAWVGAIAQDGLPWKHVSDLKYYNSEAAQEYQISAIPATYLIDPSGKIIAKGLRGESLIAKLKELFG